METLAYECGCVVTTDMFSGKFITILPCPQHKEAVYEHSYKEIQENPSLVWTPEQLHNWL